VLPEQLPDFTMSPSLAETVPTPRAPTATMAAAEAVMVRTVRFFMMVLSPWE
jgi:hypothetical protein